MVSLAMGIFSGDPLPLPPSGYFAGKWFILLGLGVVDGCKILQIKGLAAKYCVIRAYMVLE
jgi:hypothetical protein